MIVVQTRVAGTEVSDFCARCFKDSPKQHYVDGQELYLCGGCGYDLRAWTNFLRAHGVGIRRIIVVPVDQDIEEVKEDGKEGVEGEGNLPANAKGRVIPPK